MTFQQLFILCLCLWVLISCNSLAKVKTVDQSSDISKNEMLDADDYMPLVHNGARTLKEMDYDSCNYYFEKAFTIKQTSVLSTLRYAACLFSSNNESDSRLQMNKAIDLDWSNAEMIYTTYDEFAYLKGSKFDDEFNAEFLKTLESKNVDYTLMQKMKEVLHEDQRYRKEMVEIEMEHGYDAPGLDSLAALANVADSVNLAYISKLIDETGYPGKSRVGSGLASVAFLVVQHADIETQEKYLPILKKAANDGELKWKTLALLLDRINIRNGLTQKYGTQIGTNPIDKSLYFQEIENPHKIDSIRNTVGLGPIQDYAKHFQLVWNVDEHLKTIEAIKLSKKN